MQSEPDPRPRILTATRDLLGEGPVWHPGEGAVTWVDIVGRVVRRLELGTGRQDVFAMPDRPGAAVAVEDGRLLVCLARSLALFDPGTGRFEELARLEEPEGHRFNDAKCDPAGRLWVGTMNEASDAPSGGLYRFDRRGLVRMEGGIRVANSLAWSPDGSRMYFSSSPERIVRAYPFDAAAGEIGARVDLIRVDGTEAVPDGAATDAAGGLWNAQWDGWRVVRYRADGSVDRTVAMPVARPTSCCFGGADLRTLFVTSSSARLDADALARQAAAGALFSVEVGVAGTVPPPFRL